MPAHRATPARTGRTRAVVAGAFILVLGGSTLAGAEDTRPTVVTGAEFDAHAAAIDARLDAIEGRLGALEGAAPEPDPDSTALAAPTCLVGIPHADRTATLDWDDVPGATAYRVFSDLNTAEPVLITTVNESQRTSGQMTSGSYRYFIIATDGTRNSEQSPKVTVTVPGDDTPVSSPAGCDGSTPPPPTEPDPEPSPTDLRGPSGSTIIWSDDFESGLDCTPAGPWRYVGNADYAGGCDGAPATMTRLTFPDGAGEGGAGDQAARFEVRASDVASSGERSEIDTGSASSSNIFHAGDERWFQGRIKLPSTFASDVGFYIFTQFHSGIGSPPVSMSLADDGALQIGGNCDTILVPAAAMNAAKGGYVDFSLHIDFSTSSSTGGVDAWAETPDGTVYDPPRTACATLADSESYLKVGIYRNDVYSDTGVIYLDDLALSS